MCRNNYARAFHARALLFAILDTLQGMNLFNKSFYRFLFRFIGIITVTLVLILLVNMYGQ